IVFYPGTTRLRAQVRSRAGEPRASVEPLGGAQAIDAALDDFASALGKTPWLDQWPLRLAHVRVSIQPQDDGHATASLVDRDGHRVMLPARFAQAWHLLAVSGGEPIDVFGEWSGDTFTPLTVAAGGTIFSVGKGLAAMRTVA